MGLTWKKLKERNHQTFKCLACGRAIRFGHVEDHFEDCRFGWMALQAIKEQFNWPRHG